MTNSGSFCFYGNILNRLKRNHSFLVALMSLLLVVPISIGRVFSIQIPLSDVALLIAVFVYLGNFLRFESLLFSFVGGLCLLSSFLVMLEHYGEFQLRPLLSVIFFLKPFLGYFLAEKVIRDRSDMQLFLKVSLYALVVCVSLIWFSVLYKSSGMFRTGVRDLSGDILGIPLYAAFGVNSLASFYVLLFVVVCYAVAINRTSWIEKASFFFVCSALSLFIVASASRMAVLALFTFILVLSFLQLSRWPKFKWVVLVGLFVVGYIVFKSEYVAAIWGARFQQISYAIETRNWDYLSSGRLELYKLAVDQILKNIWAGTGFNGYQLYVDEIHNVGVATGLSPHNQYLTALWKAGLFGFVPYISFLTVTLRKALKGAMSISVKNITISMYAAVLVVMCLVWDQLMVANFGALFFFLVGAIGRINEDEAW